jgi:pSer/pThr/pTyr-binding forkhead associated (FHA) protein
MIECPNCHAKHVANSLICTECGTFLPTETDEFALPGDAGLSWGGAPSEPVSEATTEDQSVRVRLHIVDAGRSLEVSLEQPVCLGRLDPAASTFPDVDLTQFGGLEKGVSRRHARLKARRGAIVVEDLASINGTFVNGRRLIPYLPEVVRDGDQLQIGNIAIDLEVV